MQLAPRLRAAAGAFPPAFWALLAGSFVNRLASFVAAFLSLYLVQARGVAPAAAASIVALYGAGILVGAPAGGVLADHVGRRATLLASLVLGAAAVTALALARSTAALGALSFLAAIGTELYRPAVSAVIVDLVDAPDRPRAFALAHWAMNTGSALGLGVAGAVAARSFVGLFLADAATSLAFAGIVAAWVPETRPAGARGRSPLAGLAGTLRDGPFAGFLALSVVTFTVFLQLLFAMPLDMAAHGLGAQAFAAVMMVNGLTVALLQPLQAAWVGRRDPSRLVALSALLVGAGYGLYALAGPLPPLPVYVAGALLWSLGEVVGFPAAASLVADLSPLHLRGRYQGAYSMCAGVGFALAPLAGGRVLAAAGARPLWLGCLATCALVAAGHLAAGPARRRRVAGAARSG